MTEAAGSASGKGQKKCVFCEIIDGTKTDQQILDETEELIIVEDVHPHAKDHYLVIPEQHVNNPTTLSTDHIQLVKSMHDFGKRFLEKKSVDMSDTRIGFHWPPLVSVQHLHLHLIHPASQMSFLFRTIVFKTGFYFVTPEWLIDYIEKKKHKL